MPEIETNGTANSVEQPGNDRGGLEPAEPASAGRELPATILGRYEVLEVVGRGAFALVYRANQVGVGRIVALKVFRLHKSARQDEKSAESALLRFQREARLASSLRHPNTITLYDYDKTDTGVLYMAFEFIDGPTLAEEIKKHPAGMAPSRVIHIARQVAASLEEAHEKGIIHRDMKPGNIMLTRDRKDADYTKVLDFGIAKLVDDTEEDTDWEPDHTDTLRVVDLNGIGPRADLTGEGKIVGTPRYVPPEQIEGGELKPAADIYALGLIMHEMLCGVPANPGRSPQEMVEWHLQDKPFRSRPGYQPPAGLAAVIRKATRRASSERYTDCAELLAELARLDEDGEWIQEERRRPIVAWLLAINAAILLAALIAVAAWFMLRTPEETPQEPGGVALPAASTVPPASAAPVTAPPATVAPEASAAPPAPVGPVKLALTSEPTTVRVYLGQQRLGITPFSYTVPGEVDEVTLSFRKNGYEDRDVVWRRSEGDALPAVVLDRRGAAPRPPGSERPAPPATTAPPPAGGDEKDSKYFILK